MKRANIRIIGIQEGDESHLISAEDIYSTIIKENLSKLKKTCQ